MNLTEQEPTNHQAEDHVQPVRSPVLRWLLIAAGTVAVILGLIGILLPGIPTTPFLLVAAACYSKSSRRFYLWLMNNRYFGSYLRLWRDERRIPLHAKVLAVVMITVTLSITIIFFIPVFAVKVLLGLIGLAVVVYLLSFPS